MPTVEDVKQFWEINPLWSGESEFAAGTPEFFAEHDRVVVEDGFAGNLDERIFPASRQNAPVLDLGCGPGFWTVQLARRNFKVTAADLTQRALQLATERCRQAGLSVEFSQQNAEHMTFGDGAFAHVNCQGVIHHTPDTAACVREIARVLEPRGTASISVYYRNWLVRLWPLLAPLRTLLYKRGAQLAGRGREDIYVTRDAEELVRRYDGAANPVGKCYSNAEFRALLSPHFRVRRTYLHFFPARSLPFRVPRFAHRMLDRCAGFLIYADVERR